MRSYPCFPKQKLPLEALCRTTLSMSVQSLHLELQQQFHYEPSATASAFVQQRKKLQLSAAEDILRRFTFQGRPKQ